MKPITFNVFPPIYLQYKIHAKKRGKKVSELIREAMEYYLKQQIEPVSSLKNFIPISLHLKDGANPYAVNILDEELDEIS